MEPKDVFISYKAEEFDEADWVKSVLENNGISCWMAPMSIPGGSSYAAEIPQAIRQCKVFVLMLSEKTQNSKWVPRELDQAINASKIIMPFMIENCALKDDFNFYLTNVQRYAAYENKSAAIEKMIREIRAIMGVKCDAPEKKPTEDFTQTETKTETHVETDYQKDKIKKTSKVKAKKAGKPKDTKARKKPVVIGAIGFAVVAMICLIVVGVNLVHDSTHFSIAGKEFSVSDSYVYISNAELSGEDVKNFLNFKKVSTICLENCTFSTEDLSPLSASSVANLSLAACNLSSKQFESIDFSVMDELYSLNLSGNAVLTSTNSLADVFDTVTRLKISNTSVTSLDNIAQFEKLSELEVDNNSITSIEGLSKCEKLTYFSGNGNKISDLTPLSCCKNLVTLCVNGNELTSFAGLECCIELQEVQAGSNKLQSLSGLENATLLKTVFLNDNEIEDISVLAKSAETLQGVYLRNNKIQSISVLENCTSLKYLNIDNNFVSSISPLENCSKIVALSAAGNRIAYLDRFEGNTELSFLNLADNEITSFESDCFSFDDTANVVVELSGNQISMLELSSTCKYKYLGLHGNPINQYDSLYQTTVNYLVLDYSDIIDFESLSKLGYYNCYVVDCPLDKQVSVRDSLGKYSSEFISSSECADIFEQYIPDTVKCVVE